ncbi:MAG: NADP-specific glutamate dehydrogenase [Bacteroidetes bacterium]|nr:NADP-specific glutamate dehydrogenase [Bacteroidota bacterium]
MTTNPTTTSHELVEHFMSEIEQKNPNQPEFHQAVREFAEIVIPFIRDNKKYQGYKLMERLTEPDRAVSFRVSWVDDKGKIQVNRGYRVQFNNAIGPYKGGLRFHPSVNISILKFLGFEQIFKNSLTTLPMGGGKGGSDFDPKGKSDREVMAFCQSFMTELYRHIGPDTDVPAGDIGVGGREVGFMYGMYKKLKNDHTGVFTGKGFPYGGSRLRPEATGYGNVYFMKNMLETRGDSIEGKTCVISGSGNVAQFTAEKLIELGAKVITMSDSSGMIIDRDEIDRNKLDWIMDLKNKRRGRIREYAEEFGVEYVEKGEPWSIPCDLAFPSATQNEITAKEAQALVDNGVMGVGEGANMPTDAEGIRIFQDARILFSPGKASNAGGVGTSGLEMSQNSLRISWSRKEVDARLNEIMDNIHEQCVEYGRVDDNYVDYVKGANIAGFVRVADAMIAQGVV